MKVKHLIKKLQELDPEADLYYGDFYDAYSVRYAHLGTRLPKEKTFVLKKDALSPNPERRQSVEISMKRNGVTSLTNEDILITFWEGYGD